eukprot:jgi/Mesvir1/26021/Mv22548-RA.1
MASKREMKAAELENLRLDVEREELEAKRRRLRMDAYLNELDFELKAVNRLTDLTEAVAHNHEILGSDGNDHESIQALREMRRALIPGKRHYAPPTRVMINVEMVAREMGYDLSADEVASIDRVVEERWRERFPGGAVTHHVMQG